MLKSVSINFLFLERNTVLHYAAQHGQTKIVKILVSETDINVEARNSRGKTALEIACIEHEAKVIDILAKHTSDIHQLLLDYIKKNEPNIVRSLLRNGDLSPKSFQGVSKNPLHYAIVLDRVRITKILLRYSPWLTNCADVDGHKPSDLLTKGASHKLKALLKSQIVMT